MKGVLYGIAVGGILAYLATGFYLVGPSQRGVQTLLGRPLSPPVGPGLHYHLPRPFGDATAVDVSTVRALKVNFTWPHLPKKKAYLLTGDENVVECVLQLHWVVSDPTTYVFAAGDAPKLLGRHAEASAVEILSALKVDDALTTARPLIASKVRSALNRMADQLGIRVTSVLVESIDPPIQVKGAFAAVSSAKADAQRRIDEAMGDRNRRIPRARSKANRIITTAKAKAKELLDHTKGLLEQYYKALKQYQKAPSQTYITLYLKGISEILARVEIDVMDPQKVRQINIGRQGFFQVKGSK